MSQSKVPYFKNGPQKPHVLNKIMSTQQISYQSMIQEMELCLGHVRKRYFINFKVFISPRIFLGGGCTLKLTRN